MKLRKIGAFLAGTLLMGATLAGAVTQEVPSDFFVNPETGEFDVLIVVGSEAAAADVESAAMLATALGFACIEESGITFMKETVHQHINILTTVNWLESGSPEMGVGFPTVDVPDAHLYQEWEHNGTPISYTLESLWYFDDHHGFWGNNNGHFDPWETHEEIQIRFDSHTGTADSDCVTCLHGGDITHVNLSGNLDLSWYDVPGLIYRADNIFVPPALRVELPCCYPRPEAVVSLCDCFGRRAFTVPEPWMVAHDRLPRFKLFDTVYTVVDGGALLDMNFRTGELGDVHGAPYIVTGTPHFEPLCLHKNESVNYGSYTVELLDVHLGRNLGLFEISENGEIIDNFWMALNPQSGFSVKVKQEKFPFDAYRACEDLNGNRELDPGEITNIIDYDTDDYGWGTGFKKWIVGYAEDDIWADYRWEYYTDARSDVWGFSIVALIVIDGVRLFTDDQGDGAEIQIYWLEDEKVWYSHLCSDPWVTDPSYQIFLDAYQAGWDTVDANDYVYQPPGTGLWPHIGLQCWHDRYVSQVFTNTCVGNGFLDTNDGHTGYEYWQAFSDGNTPEQNDLDRDSDTTSDCRNAAWISEPACKDQCDIEDPMIWHGPGVTMVELNVFLCENLCSSSADRWSVSGPFLESPYFIIGVTDVCFSPDRDGIDYETIMTCVDETELILTDTEFYVTEWEETCDLNLILIGGPVANLIVKELVDEGMSAVDWATSPGEWEYIPAPYGKCDILIVAGADRDATRRAVQGIIDLL